MEILYAQDVLINVSIVILLMNVPSVKMVNSSTVQHVKTVLIDVKHVLILPPVANLVLLAIF